MIILRRRSFSDYDYIPGEENDYISDATEDEREPEIYTHDITDNASSANLEFFRENNPDVEIYATEARESDDEEDPVFAHPLSPDAMIN